MRVKKADLLARVSAELERTGGVVLSPPVVRDGATGDVGDQGAEAAEWWRRDALYHHTGELRRAQLQALKAVDLSPADRVRVGALVRVLVSPGIPAPQYYLVLPCSFPPGFLWKQYGCTVITPESPVGAALMRKGAGEIVQVTTPRGTCAIRILGVE